MHRSVTTWAAIATVSCAAPPRPAPAELQPAELAVYDAVFAGHPVVRAGPVLAARTVAHVDSSWWRRARATFSSYVGRQTLDDLDAKFAASVTVPPEVRAAIAPRIIVRNEELPPQSGRSAWAGYYQAFGRDGDPTILSRVGLNRAQTEALVLVMTRSCCSYAIQSVWLRKQAGRWVPLRVGQDLGDGG